MPPPGGPSSPEGPPPAKRARQETPLFDDSDAEYRVAEAVSSIAPPTAGRA